MKNTIQNQTLSQLNKQFQQVLSSKSKFQLTLPANTRLSKVEQSLVIELGGTHLKLYQLDQKGNVQKSHKTEFYHDITYTPEVLNKQLLHHIKQFLPATVFEKLSRIFFVFAYPLQPFFRKNILDGICLKFSKSHHSKNLIGSKIGENLENFLNKKAKLKTEVITFNDSLCTVFGNFKHSSDTLNLGLIVGTGTNCGVAYPKQKEIHFFNTEFGTFNIPSWSEIDEALLKKTGKDYQTEKMISGNWQNQLYKIALDLLSQKELIEIPKNIDQLEKMNSGELENYFIKSNPKNENEEILQELWFSYSERASSFLALTISALISQFKYKKVNLTLTGAVLQYGQNFQKNFLQELKVLCPKTSITSKLIDNPTPLAIKNLFF